ncbi:MAG: hypothetical protein JSV32_00670 [Dehalococcoidia bacterium]|nr:MAG: hypothetical protein JSV32_00670 [Dehalococcoidia bacterium]
MNKERLKNHRAKNIDRYLTRGKDMTLIMGAKCINGIALIGDRKITIDSGADYTYGDKLFAPLNTIVVGSSGLSGMYKSFQNRVLMAIKQHQKEGMGVGAEETLAIIEQIMHQMLSEYGESIMANGFDVLMAMRNTPEPELNRIIYLGLPEPVIDYKCVGHGEPYASLLLKTLWKKDMSMMQFAKLGCFTIRFIENLNLDNSVGGLPQVYFIPKIQFDKTNPPTEQKEWDELWEKYPIRQLKEEEIEYILQSTEHNITNIQNMIKRISL